MLPLVERAPNKGLKKVRAPFPSPLERLEGLGHVKVDVEVFCCVAEETVYSKSSSKAQKIDFPVTASRIFFKIGSKSVSPPNAS